MNLYKPILFQAIRIYILMIAVAFRLQSEYLRLKWHQKYAVYVLFNEVSHCAGEVNWVKMARSTFKGLMSNCPPVMASARKPVLMVMSQGV